MRWRWGVVAFVLVCVPVGAALADAPVTAFSAVTSTIGGSVSVSAQLVDAGAYALSISDPSPAKGATCSARLAGPTRAVKGRISLSGKIPTSIACYGSSGSVLSHVKMTPGTYTLTLCQPVGATGCDTSRTVITHPVSVRLPAVRGRPKPH